MGEITIEHACADGTPFPVTFASEEDAAKTWRLEQEHSVGPATPLARAVGPAGRPGGVRAYDEVGLPFPSFWVDGPDAHGWPYFSDGPPEPEEMAALFGGCAALVERHGSAHGVWVQDSLPRVRAVCEWLQTAPDVPFAQLAEAQTYAHHHTMVSAYIAGNDIRLLEEVLVDLGDDPSLLAYELSQGHESETLRANELLHDAVTSGDVAALDAFLDRYGWRSELWSIDFPTWRERGPGFRALLDACATSEPPAAVAARAGARRAALTEELAARIDDEARRSRFLRRVDRLSTYLPVREDRAMWQLVSVGSLRHAVRAHGERLVDRRCIDAVDDVFFLTPEEYDDPTSIDRDVLAHRRAEHERWSAVEPPRTVGGSAPEPAPAGRELRGIGASRGVARGRARIVADLAESDRLQPGDVLVCPTTAPPWTPLFSVASALVVDTGDLGSHAAIAAREYGLPCVVRVVGATKRIPDGAEVVVDGAAGTVEVVS